MISKILANRLKPLLPNFIAPNQSAFVKGRLLLENVLLATELVNDYHKDNIAPRSAFKLDISKAFDTVQWAFITKIFQALGFPDLFVHWIYVFVYCFFLCCCNGELEGIFTSTRGIRQGYTSGVYIRAVLYSLHFCSCAKCAF